MTASQDHCGKCGLGFAYGSKRIHMNDGRVYHQCCLDAQPVPELEIARLRKVEEVARAFLSEWDNPTPDYALRVNLKQRLRALVQ